MIYVPFAFASAQPMLDRIVPLMFSFTNGEGGMEIPGDKQCRNMAERGKPRRDHLLGMQSYRRYASMGYREVRMEQDGEPAVVLDAPQVHDMRRLGAGERVCVSTALAGIAEGGVPRTCLRWPVEMVGFER